MSYRWLIAFAILLSLCTYSLAQGPGGFGPGGGRGPGGPFRMMIGGPGGNLPALLGIPEVQKELALTDDQKKQVEETQVAVRESMDEMFRTFDPASLQDLGDEEREQKMEEMRTKSEALNKKHDEALLKSLNEKQSERVKQLRLQREGVNALIRDDIAKKLEITDEQRQKLEEIQTQAFSFGPPRANPEALAKAVAILTDAQKKEWSGMTGEPFTFPAEQFGFGGPGGRGGPGGFGPGGGPDRKLVKQFDKNNDGWLNADERKAAKAASPAGGRGPGGRGGPGGFGPGGRSEPGKPGPKVAVEDVKPIKDAGLYDESVLRTLFLEFENGDWESEMESFKNSDVDVVATLIVDGQKYPGVGVSFRGMSSFGGVPTGSKRSMNIALDTVDSKQRLYGYKNLNLLNAHEDPSMMHAALYSHIARQYIPAPKANFVKVVINGESWGVYTNVQQFDKEFLNDFYKTTKGTRWKVKGSPGGDGGLSYVGDNVAEYKRRYEIKSKDDDKAWQALINLCKTLKETPVDQLEEKLAPILDIDGALWFLALDAALINGDGYWTRASDYYIYLDEKGKFHVIPHDMNETFHAGGGPGMGGPGGRGRGGRGGEAGGDRGGPGDRRDGERGRGGDGRGFGGDRPVAQGGDRPAPGGERQGPMGDRPMGGERGFGPRGQGGRGMGPGAGGIELDPLVALLDDRKPLRSKLLQVPTFKAQYLSHVRTIAQKDLDWKNLGPVVESYQKLIEKEVEADTRKLTTYTAFQQAVNEPTGDAGRNVRNLSTFASQRRTFLLNHAEIKKLPE